MSERGEGWRVQQKTRLGALPDLACLVAYTDLSTESAFTPSKLNLADRRDRSVELPVTP